MLSDVGIQIPSIDNKKSFLVTEKHSFLFSLCSLAPFTLVKLQTPSQQLLALMKSSTPAYPKNLLCFLKHCADNTISCMKETVKVIIAW